MSDDWVTVIPAIEIHRDHHPELYARLSRMGREQAKTLTLNALEWFIGVKDPDTILSTILEQVQAIRSKLEGEDTPLEDLPPSVEDALANLGKGHA